MNILNKIILFIFAIGVLISYYVVFGKLYKSNKSYSKHEFWFGMNQTVINILIYFQIIAAIGFIIAIFSWFKNPPKQGVMSNENILFLTFLAFFTGSIIWPFAVYYKKHWLVIISLIVVAIASILLLAGSVEDFSNNRWYITMGLFCLCIVTVLGDSVMWNANYIKNI